MAPLKVSVLISGRGSNLQALIDACATPSFPARIVKVISNRPAVEGLARAENARIPTQVIDHREDKDRTAFDSRLHEALLEAGTELVCLAGFMRLLTAGLVDAWRDRMINIHPSLLPAFPGAHGPALAIAAGVRVSGCTVHLVTSEVDAGPILAQAEVPILPGDTVETLHARIREVEHRILPEVVGELIVA